MNKEIINKLNMKIKIFLNYKMNLLKQIKIIWMFMLIQRIMNNNLIK